MERSFRVLAYVVVGGLGFAGASPGLAATANQAATKSGGEIEEVVVTAERRSETVQNVPAAITALSGQTLRDRGIDSVNNLQFAVPSFHSGTLTGSTGITIRGVGATTVGTAGTAGVAVSVDGVYQSQTSTMDLAQMDLKRVEVLRGPQGTLYGRNATGGAVNFITNAPTDQLSASLLAGYASYNEEHLQTVVNVPITAAVRTRLVVDYRDRHKGFVQNVLPGGESVDKGKTWSSRFRLAADLTSNLKFDLELNGIHNDGPWQYLTNYSKPDAAAFARNPPLAKATFIQTPWRTDINDPVYGVRDYQSASGTFTWQLPFGTLKSISAFQNYRYTYANDGDGTNISLAPYRGKNTDQTRTQEFDLTGTSGNLDWVTGMFYLSESDKNLLAYDFVLGLSGLPPHSYLDFEEPHYSTTSYAAFADGTYHLTNALNLIAGVRYSHDHINANYGNFFGLLVSGTKVPVAAFCPYETDALTSSSVTPRAGAQYRVNDNLNFYFTWSKGYKSGGANVYSCADDYSPERITAYEGGLKSVWLDNALTFNMSVFHYKYSDFQVSQIVGLALDVTNAAAAKVDGVEFEANWALDQYWSLNANYSHINAVYTDFSNIDGLNPGLGRQNLNGNLLDNSPRNSANIGIVWNTGMLSIGEVTVMVDASYRSRTYFREFNNPLDSQPAYSLANVNLIWDSRDGRYSARLYVDNASNKAYIQAMGDSTSIGTRYVTWGAPRQAGLEFKVRI